MLEEDTMSPTRIIYIRHAEKPVKGIDSGVSDSGTPDPKSLSPLGWQRAGALVRFFCPTSGVPDTDSITPSTVFAANVDTDDPSKRPIETVTPLVNFLNTKRLTEFVTTYQKGDHEGLTEDVLKRAGIVLVSWEHKQIPALIACLPNAPATPTNWPDNRFDMCWVLDRTESGWLFSQRPQMLLANDQSTPILQ
jgi:hypothetical protein